jgi:outer membrane protein OmpA-like peptidoglycan-associated protein
MVNRSCLSTCALALVMTLGVVPVEAQLGGLIRRAARSANDELEREIERLVREGVRCVFHDEECIDRARADGRTPIMTDDDGNLITDDDGKPVTDPAEAAARTGQSARPGEGAWTNFDFVPGDRVLFYDDYTDDRVGDFPRPFNFIAGNWEVVEWQGQRFIRGTTGGTISIDLAEVLPERFTIEFPASVQHGNAFVRVSTAPIDHGARDYAGSAPSLQYDEGGLRPIREQGPLAMTPRREGATKETMVNLRIMADGNYMKVYLDEHRVANVPNAVFPRGDTIYFTIDYAYDENPVMIGPLRVAAGGRDLYDRLEADGRAAIQGIYFAVDSDVIRPESTGTLEEIGTMLSSHPELRLSIEGHTDSNGDGAYNLDLSGRRAVAVKAHLVSAFGIDAGRLETTGLGETTPAADNATPEGRQQNRRVELVKIGG